MSDAPEIPEANDPFAQRVAITIAALAVAMSLIGNQGDNAKTDAIIKTSEAANSWSHYQAKSIKGHIDAVAAEELAVLSVADPAKRDALVASFAASGKVYETDKAKLQVEADALTAAATHSGSINDRCDLGSLLLQIAVILCSVAILVRQHRFWILGVVVGGAGAAVGATAFFM